MTIPISKLDAARRQLTTAVILYFNNLDVVSIHALAAAAYEVVEAIAKKRGHSTLIQRSLFDFLTDDMVKGFRKSMRKPQNFFKHADQDPDAKLEFDPDSTELVILGAMVTYAQITGEISMLFNAFSVWFTLQKPEKLGRSPEVQAKLAKAKEYFGHLTRQEFLRMYLADAAAIKHGHESA